nr:TonB-dependent receptor [uncultured Flavobacterium sp.]
MKRHVVKQRLLIRIMKMTLFQFALALLFSSVAMANSMKVLKKLDTKENIPEENFSGNEKQKTVSKNKIIENTIKGRITDKQGLPLPGATVLVKNSNKSTITDLDGNYTIDASESDILVFSYIGFATKEVAVSGQKTINVVLGEDISKLNEIVVVGYGQKSRATLIGAVSTVKGSELVKSPQANVSNSIAGRLSGVIALNRSGEPGEDGSTIRIRGISTTGKNDPLIVIDGIANRLGGLERLNPNDIENVTVLKDASAAIYGSQAANGVILVTTKRGKKGKPELSLSYNKGFTKPANLPQMADSPTYAALINEINYYRNPTGGLNQIYSQSDIQAFASGSNPDKFANTNWIKESIRNFSQQDNESLSVRGGGENVTYYASLGRVSQEGIFKNGINKFEQINLRSNLDIQVTDNLKVGVDLSLRKEDRLFPNSSAGAIFRSIYRTYPTIPARFSNGLPSAGVESGLNPILLPTGIRGTNVQPTTVINTTLNFEYKLPFIQGLALKGFYSEDRNFKATKKFDVPYSVYQINNSTTPATFNEVIAGPSSRGPELYQAQENTSLQTANIRLDFDRHFDKHHVSTFVAYEQQESNFSQFDAFRSGFISSQIPEFNLGGGEPAQSSNSGYSTKFTRQNFFGRVSYDYDKKYLTEIQARYDGSSRFAKDSRFGFFPSLSLGWRMSEEKWFKSKAVSNLKFKATYGLLGNDRIDPFQYLNTYRLRATDFVDNTQTPLPIFILDQLANPNITWETAKKLDLGFEARLFDDFNLEFDYFSEKRGDLLTTRGGSLPFVSGIVNEYGEDSIIPQENIGEVKNQGFEVVLNYNKTIGDFDLYASGNFTYNKNKVVFLDDAAGVPDYQLRKGKPLNADLLYDAVGIFKTQADLDSHPKLAGQQLGDLIYRDVDGNGLINGNDRIRQDLTNIPQIIYGLSLGGNYKQFDFSVLLQGQARSVQYVAAESGEVGNFFSSWADNRWSPNNPNGTYPRADVRTSSSINEGLFRNNFWLQNTSFLRLKNVEIGYTIPENLMTKFGLKSARLYVSGFNLATFTKAKDVDPEGDSTNGQFYPQQQIYNLGINVNF